MKAVCLTTMITVLLLSTNGIQAQTKLKQSELIQQFLGTWQHNLGKDSIEVWEVQQYKNAFVTYLCIPVTLYE